MSRLTSLHNKTQDVPEGDLPYNPSNVLLQADDLRKFFDENGLEGVQFHNLNLYRNAFVHRSYCTMKNHDFDVGNQRCPPDCLPLQEMSYERLEFLGDAILGMVVAHYLVVRYPDQDEGFLSRLRTKIVNGKMLGHLADLVGFPKFVILSKQIEESLGRQNYKTMEDVFEAFIGALYMDFQNEADDVVLPSGLDNLQSAPFMGGGFFVAQAWIISILERFIDFSDLIQAKTNFKDMLVRFMQQRNSDAPRFFEVSVAMQKGQKVFTYTVKDKAGAILGTATGMSKKDAENNAAKAALDYYGVGPS